jgi:hypothetical protein
MNKGDKSLSGMGSSGLKGLSGLRGLSGLKGASGLKGLGEKNVFGFPAVNPKAASDKRVSSSRSEGGRERANLKATRQYCRERSKEIKTFKRQESREASIEKANFFLEREEETMRSLFSKRRR